MCAIVSYDDTCEADFVPMKWLTDQYNRCDVELLIKNRVKAKFYCPSRRNMSNVTNARQCCVDAELDWPIYAARILATAGQQCFALL